MPCIWLLVVVLFTSSNVNTEELDASHTEVILPESSSESERNFSPESWKQNQSEKDKEERKKKEADILRFHGYVTLLYVFIAILIWVAAAMIIFFKKPKVRSDHIISQYILETTFFISWLRSMINEIEKENYGQDANNREELLGRKTEILKEVAAFQKGIASYWLTMATKSKAEEEQHLMILEGADAQNIIKAFDIPKSKLEPRRFLEDIQETESRFITPEWAKKIRTVKGIKYFLHIQEAHNSTKPFEWFVKKDDILPLCEEEPVRINDQSFWMVEKMGDIGWVPQALGARITNGKAMVELRSREIKNLVATLNKLVDEKYSCLLELFPNPDDLKRRKNA